MTGKERALTKKVEKLEEKVKKRDNLLEFYARQWKRSDRIAHDTQEGAQELTDLTNAVLIATALTYGAKSPTGARVLALGEVRTKDLLSTYKMQAEKKGTSYIVRVTEKG